MRDPLQVLPKRPGDKLDVMSRVNFRKVYTVEHNVKVYDFGHVHPGQIHQLESTFFTVWIPSYSVAQTAIPATQQALAAGHSGYIQPVAAGHEEEESSDDDDDDDEDDNDEDEEEEEEDDIDNNDDQGHQAQSETATGAAYYSRQQQATSATSARDPGHGKSRRYYQPSSNSGGRRR